MDFISGLMTRSCNDSTNNKIVKSNDPAEGYTRVEEDRFGRNWTGTHGKANSTKIMLGIRYAFNANPIGKNTPLFAKIQKARYSRKLKKQRSGQDILRRTEFDQKATPVDQPFQVNAAARIVENITYWIGEASSTADFHKGISESNRKIESKSWDEAIDQMRQLYPDIEGQLGEVYEPINIDLYRLQEATKRALLAATQETGTEAVFEDMLQRQTLITDDSVDQDAPIMAEFNRSSEETGLKVLEAPPDENIVSYLPTEEAEEAEEKLVDEVPNTEESPSTENVPPEIKLPKEETLQDSELSRSKVFKLLDDSLEHADATNNKKLDDLVTELDDDYRKNRISGSDVKKRLENFDRGREPSEEQIREEYNRNYVNLWENKAKDETVPLYLWKNIIDTIIELGIEMPPNLKSAYNKMQSGLSNTEIPDTDTFDTETGPDEAGLKESEEFLKGTDYGKSMPLEPETNFIGKRQTKRRLFKKRDNTGKVQRAEVIDTLIKVADLLDIGGEYLVADKVELLLYKVMNN